MKIFSISYPFALLAIWVSAGVGAVVVKENSNNRLTELRSQLQRYENAIIHTYLARFALPTSTNLGSHSVQSQCTQFAQPDAEVAKWLTSQTGSPFNSEPNAPPGTQYKSPKLVDDETLQKHSDSSPGTSGQIAETVVQFVQSKLETLKKDANVDGGSLVLLNHALFQLISARILLGYQIGLVKFDNDKRTYCEILIKHPVSKTAIQNQLTDVKQMATVLARVQEKAQTFSKLFPGDAEYPPHSTHDLVLLYQDYIIPITTQVEVQAIIAQTPRCTPNYR